MDPHTLIHLAVGAVLLLSSLSLAIYSSATGKQVQTWTPFIWSAVLGILIMPASFGVANAAVNLGGVRIVLELIGACLVLGSLGTSMHLALGKKEVSTWTPMIWGTVVGLLLL